MENDYRFEGNTGDRFDTQYCYVDDNIEEIDHLTRELRHLVYVEEDKLNEVYAEISAEMKEVKEKRDSFEGKDEDQYDAFDEEYWELDKQREAVEDAQEYIAKLSEVL